MSSLARSDDHVHDVLAKLVGKLGHDDWRGLKRYRPWRERHPDKSFEDWIHIVVANAVRDHVRSQLGETKAPRSPAEPSLKRLLNEFAASPALAELGVRPPMTAAQTARQLLEFAHTRLPPDQCSALMLWIDGATFDEIDAEIEGTEGGHGQRLVRAAIATLRRHFTTPGEGS
jgi:DNA-directed RNA polymerase specialized sigma24 family protein